MPRLLGRRLTLGLLVLLSIAPLRAQLTFTFDYSLDTGNFFTGPNEDRRQYLEAAGAYVSQYFYGTSLVAITPTVGGNSWNATVSNPANPSSTVSLGNLTVPQNTVIVYAGGTALAGGVLAKAGPGGYNSSSGEETWTTYTVPNRSLTAGDFRTTAVGSLSFDLLTSWFFDTTPETKEGFAGKYDFFSVAAHELLHVLGFGVVGKGYGWSPQFLGPASFAGGNVLEERGDIPVSLSSDKGHWAAGTISFSMRDGTSQGTLMVPDIGMDVRKYLTSLDLRAMQDIGYTANFTAVPEPAAFGVGAGVISLVWAWRRRRAQS